MVVHQPAYLRPDTPPPVGRRPPSVSGRCAVWRLACGGRGAAGYPARTCSGVRRMGRTIPSARTFVRSNLYFCGCSINCACACTIGCSRMVLRCRSPIARRPPMPPVATDPAPCEWPPAPQTRWAVTWRPEHPDGSRPHSRRRVTPAAGPDPFCRAALDRHGAPTSTPVLRATRSGRQPRARARQPSRSAELI